ncbi:ABC transporter substrate-binding protein [Rhodobacteraceae bacterium D3-12]|nr:ABC transporter substrate-binding protein [Rhodobacteraceae bacterium D3-12]
MRRVHPFFWLQASLCLLLGAIIVTSARADVQAQRIVSVGGAITEIVYALGQEDRLVARDTTSNYPPAALELPDVGYIRRLSPEGVLSVNPDLLILQEGAGPVEAMDLLRATGVAMVEVPEGYDAEAVLTKVTVVANALGVPEKGAALVEDLRKEFLAAGQDVSGLQDRKVLFVLSMAGGRVMVGGQNSSASGIIAMAGASNAATGFDGYKPMSDEAIAQSGADVILMMASSGPRGASDEQLFQHPAIAATPAGQNKAVVRMDGMKLLGFSVRTAEAVRALSKALRDAGS